MYWKPKTKKGRIEFIQSQINYLVEKEGAKVERFMNLIFVTFETRRTGRFRKDGLIITKEFTAYNLNTWRGTKTDPIDRYYYRSIEARQKAIDDRKKQAKERGEYEKQEKEKAKNFATSLKIGDILYSSWGYDQTNIDFFQVTKVISEKTIEITPIGQIWHEAPGHFLSEYVTAKKDNFTGPPMRKRVSRGESVRITSFSHASKWDGQKLLQSHYA